MAFSWYLWPYSIKNLHNDIYNDFNFIRRKIKLPMTVGVDRHNNRTKKRSTSTYEQWLSSSTGLWVMFIFLLYFPVFSKFSNMNIFFFLVREKIINTIYKSVKSLQL